MSRIFSSGEPGPQLTWTAMIVHVKFTVVNPTDVAALDGFLSLQLCDVCTFAQEPKGLNKLAGDKVTIRNMDFTRILPRTALPDLEADIRVPGVGTYPIAVLYRCRTCILQETINNRVPEIDFGYITAVNRQ